MKKIPAVFQYDPVTLVRGPRPKTSGARYSEIVTPGCEWVLRGEGIATEKIDGTAMLWAEGKLWRRYDRKKVDGVYKDAKPGWIAAQDPDGATGHWPGWLPVGDGPEDCWAREARWDRDFAPVENATYELIGPKINGNPYDLADHVLIRHGHALDYAFNFDFDAVIWGERGVPRDSRNLVSFFKAHPEIEGVVFHHPDGRMAKLTRAGFGFQWPPPKGAS